MEERTPQEEHRILLSNLPKSWQRVVLKEESRKRKNKWVVRLANMPVKPPALVQSQLQEVLGSPLDSVKDTVNGYVVVCPSAQVQKKVLDLADWTFDGRPIRVSRMECSLSNDEICDFITERLQTETKLFTIQRTLPGPKPMDVSQVQSSGPEGHHSPRPGSSQRDKLNQAAPKPSPKQGTFPQRPGQQQVQRDGE